MSEIITDRTICTDKDKLINHWNCAFVSDIHLGSRGCQADVFSYFLDNNHFNKIYLVGDFFDGWRFRQSHYWNQSYTNSVLKLLQKSRKGGTKIIWIGGNHDDFLTPFLGGFGELIDIQREDLYRSISGKSFVVLHGHQFDTITARWRRLAKSAAFLYDTMIVVNRWINYLRKKLRMRPWSMSKYIKTKAKNSVNVISGYEDAVSTYAARKKADGIITGHLHIPALEEKPHLLYFNTGDFIEDCTAILEDFNGKFLLVQYLNGTTTVVKEMSFS